MPLNQWAKTPRPPQTQLTSGPPSAWSARGPGVATAAPPIVDQVANLTDRLDRQEAMFEAVLERLSATLPSPSTGAAPGLGHDIDVTAAMPVMQLATAVPLPAQVPLIIGGAQPEGYIYVGTNGGLSRWEHAEVVAASVTEVNSESGNV